MTAPKHEKPCAVCKAAAGQPCKSLIDGGPLPGRAQHVGRYVRSSKP